MGNFFSRVLIEVKVREFITLKKECTSLHDYNLKFTQLSGYASELFSYTRSDKCLFISGLFCLSRKAAKVDMLIGNIDIKRILIPVSHVEEEKLRDRDYFLNKEG